MMAAMLAIEDTRCQQILLGMARRWSLKYPGFDQEFESVAWDALWTASKPISGELPTHYVRYAMTSFRRRAASVLRNEFSRKAGFRPDFGVSDRLDTLASRMPSHELRIDAIDAMRILFATLEPVDREILRLAYEDTMELEQIGERVGLHWRTVMARRDRAIDKMRKHLGESVVGDCGGPKKRDFVGINYHKQNKRWEANITINGKRKLLGCRFLTAEDAARAYDAALEAAGGPTGRRRYNFPYERDNEQSAA